MTTLLHINSSVRKQGSHTRQLTAEFVAKWKAEHPSAVVVDRDLASGTVPHLSEEMMGAFFTPETQRTPQQAKTIEISDRLVDELLAADVIVIGAPMYNFSVTSTLKAWIDHVARAGRTFKYTDKGPVGLVTGKKVYVVTASGSVFSEGPWKSHDFLSTYLRSVFGFLGITDVTFVPVEGVALGEAATANALVKSRAALADLLPADAEIV